MPKRKVSPKCAPTVPQLCLNCAPTAFASTVPQLCPNCAPSNFMPQLCPSCAPTVPQLCPRVFNFVPQLCLNCAPTVPQLCLARLPSCLMLQFGFSCSIRTFPSSPWMSFLHQFNYEVYDVNLFIISDMQKNLSSLQNQFFNPGTSSTVVFGILRSIDRKTCRYSLSMFSTDIILIRLFLHSHYSSKEKTIPWTCTWR